MDNSKGRYWDKPWSLVDGCTPCSPGCEHCWSMAMAKRFHKWPDKVTPRPERLDIPLRTRKPTVFSVWNDLFHEDVPDDFRDQAFGMMANCERHTFLVLTKRADRMAEYFANEWRWALIEGDAQKIYADKYHEDPSMWFAVHDLPHVWLGTTVCTPDEIPKIHDLLKVPGKHFLSIEPMLGPIDLKPFLGFWQWSRSENFQTWVPHSPSPIDLVILGGETGPGARPMHPDWVRLVRDQCMASGTPFYLKQNGEWSDSIEGVTGNRLFDPEQLRYMNDDGTITPLGMGYQPSKRFLYRVGSKAAGRLLDGREWNELPWIRGQHNW